MERRRQLSLQEVHMQQHPLVTSSMHSLPLDNPVMNALLYKVSIYVLYIIQIVDSHFANAFIATSRSQITAFLSVEGCCQ